MLSFSGTFALRGDWRGDWRGGLAALPGVVLRLIGVTARPAAAEFHGLWSGFRLAVTCDFFVIEVFDIGDVGLDDPERLLGLLLDNGSRDADLAASCICALGVEVIKGVGSTLILVFTLLSAESL